LKSAAADGIYGGDHGGADSAAASGDKEEIKPA